LSIIPALRKQKQEDHEFKANLGYIARHLKKERKEKERKVGRRNSFHWKLWLASVW
jgi:hypothetical protein